MEELPNISLVTVLHNWSNFIKSFKDKYDMIDYPKEKIEWIIVDSSQEDHSDMIPLEENILYIKLNSDEYLEKINFKYDEEKIIWNYFDKTAIDIFKIFLWSFIKNNNYNKKINGTKVMILNNLKSVYKFFDYPVLIMFIITSMTLSLIPEKLIKLIKANISS